MFVTLSGIVTLLQRYLFCPVSRLTHENAEYPMLVTGRPAMVLGMTSASGMLSQLHQSGNPVTVIAPLLMV